MNITIDDIKKQIEERFNNNMEHHDFSGSFMTPQIDDTADLVAMIGEDHDLDIDAPYHIRLSARGYMDCTDWEPVTGPDCLDAWFDLWCEDEYRGE